LVATLVHSSRAIHFSHKRHSFANFQRELTFSHLFDVSTFTQNKNEKKTNVELMRFVLCV